MKIAVPKLFEYVHRSERRHGHFECEATIIYYRQNLLEGMLLKHGEEENFYAAAYEFVGAARHYAVTQNSQLRDIVSAEHFEAMLVI